MKTTPMTEERLEELHQECIEVSKFLLTSALYKIKVEEGEIKNWEECKMKIFKRYSTAKKEAKGRPIIRIANIFIVGDFKSCDEIEIIESNGNIKNHITFAKFSKLGNGNYAIPEKQN